ncbi:hypothetical protein [Verminephrobacter eiseniae]|uniref:hypothetical protein n=1 Tax=Verminephrobacter eiseniae TaxID=364317 RepID=UPI0012EE0AF8|nr:hypothetical protein [Verminephrobacter eiseniae]
MSRHRSSVCLRHPIGDATRRAARQAPQPCPWCAAQATRHAIGGLALRLRVNP